MKAWYFSDETRKLRYNDGREIALGVTHEVEGKPVLCEHGLHGSEKILDALEYAPGSIVWYVELDGEMDIGDDKISAQKRMYIAGGIDIADIFRKFYSFFWGVFIVNNFFTQFFHPLIFLRSSFRNFPPMYFFKLYGSLVVYSSVT